MIKKLMVAFVVCLVIASPSRSGPAVLYRFEATFSHVVEVVDGGYWASFIVRDGDVCEYYGRIKPFGGDEYYSVDGRYFLCCRVLDGRTWLDGKPCTREALRKLRGARIVVTVDGLTIASMRARGK